MAGRATVFRDDSQLAGKLERNCYCYNAAIKAATLYGLTASPLANLLLITGCRIEDAACQISVQRERTISRAYNGHAGSSWKRRGEAMKTDLSLFSD